MKRRVKTVHQAIAATIGISLLWISVPAKAYPELRYEHVQLNSVLERCANQAYAVLQENGFRQLQRSFNSATGYQPGIKAVIDCTSIGRNLTQATIIVAGESDRTSADVSHSVTALYKAINGYESLVRSPFKL